MPARCHVDTCTVKWSEQTNPAAYIANVDIDGDATPSGTPTIACGASGLEVLVSPDAGNILAKTANGLFAGIPNLEYQDFGSLVANTPIAIDRNTDTPGGFAVSTETYGFVNDTGRNALLFLHGRFHLVYGIVGVNEAFPASTPTQMIRAGHVDSDGDGSGDIVALTPFNAQWYCSLLVDSDVSVDNDDAHARAARMFPTSGISVTPDDGDDVQFQQFSMPFTFATPLASGASLYVKHRWAHAGPEQTINVAAGGTGIYEDLGGHLIGQALLLPINSVVGLT